MIDERFVADVNLLAPEKRRHRNHDRELLQISLEVVRHRHNGPIGVANQHHLRGLVEQFRIGLRDVEAAEPENRRRRPRDNRRHDRTKRETFHTLLLCINADAAKRPADAVAPCS